MYKIAVFVSGRGSNLKSIFEAFADGVDRVCVEAIVSNKHCPAIDFAKENNIKYFFVGENSDSRFITYSKLSEELKKLSVDLIILAGFIKKIPDDFVDQYENKIINIHPALLPSFGGKGMYGLNVHTAVFNSSAQVSGASVHFVDKIYDNGKIIAQRCTDIPDVKSPEEIAARVLKIEHELLPFVVRKFAQNKIKIINGRIYTE